MLVAVALAATAWIGSDKVMQSRSRQQAADRWDALRVCLLGDGLRAGTKPSERLRFIQLAAIHSDASHSWPKRCAPYAEELDAALATRTLRRQLAGLPSATELVAADDITDVADQLDRLHQVLEAADLPLPTRTRAVLPAPAPISPLLTGEQLASFGRDAELGNIDAALDPVNGRILRLLLAEPRPLTCRFNDGPREQRWRTLACRQSPMQAHRGRLRLAPAEPGAADLIHARDHKDRDGFYDGTSGLAVWRPRYFDAQALVRKSGETTIFFAQLRDKSRRSGVDHFRMLRFEPGKTPLNRRISVPPEARAALLPKTLLWWRAESVDDGAQLRDVLYAQPLVDGKRIVGSKRRLATLPRGSRRIASCAAGDTRALLFATGVRHRRYSLLFQQRGAFAPPLDVGVIEGSVQLSCHGGEAILTRLNGARISHWRCDTERCVQTLTDIFPALDHQLAAVAPVGDKLLAVWAAPNEPLRLRIAAPAELGRAVDQLLLDDASHSGFDAAALRLIASDGLALLLLQDEAGRVYGVRIDDAGTATAVRIVR